MIDQPEKPAEQPLAEGTPPEAPKKRKGRPPLLRPYAFDKKIAKGIIDDISMGLWVDAAVGCAGIARKTLYNWLKRGRKESDEAEKAGLKRPSELAAFYRSFKRAKHKAHRLHVRVMFTAAARGLSDPAKLQTRASEWWLERSLPERFGNRQKLEHTGAKGAPLAPAVVIELPSNGSMPAPPPAEAPQKKKG